MTATQASRHFSEMLDQIEHGGEEIEIVRNGKSIAMVTSASKRGTIGDLIALNQDFGITGDDEFSRDVLAAKQEFDRLPERNIAFDIGAG